MGHHVAGIVPREILACVGHRVIHIGQCVPLPAVIISSVVICAPHLCWRHGEGKHILSRDTPVFVVSHPHRIHQAEMVWTVFPGSRGVGEPVQTVILVTVAVCSPKVHARIVCGVDNAGDVAHGIVGV